MLHSCSCTTVYNSGSQGSSYWEWVLASGLSHVASITAQQHHSHTKIHNLLCNVSMQSGPPGQYLQSRSSCRTAQHNNTAQQTTQPLHACRAPVGNRNRSFWDARSDLLRATCTHCNHGIVCCTLQHQHPRRDLQLMKHTSVHHYSKSSCMCALFKPIMHTQQARLRQQPPQCTRKQRIGAMSRLTHPPPPPPPLVLSWPGQHTPSCAPSSAPSGTPCRSTTPTCTESIS
mmetsp:Transcript_33755/g.85423  ORF Transcript_33755/g.85423 Transcript_33755/m.85423 type:complete len:230 (+) Transcript_33755:152-841(+)